MNGTDKVIIALGFFALIGFMSYLYFLRASPITTVPASLNDGEMVEISRSDLKKIRENWIVRR